MSSFYPAVSGRTSNQLGISRLLFQINNDQNAIQSLQTQLSTGRRISVPSDDPGAAIRALTAQRQLEFKAQVDDNLQSADTILSATESTLAQAQSIMNEMRGVAVQSIGTTLSDAERAAFSEQVQSAISKLAELGNSKFRDQFIFGGSSVLDNPFDFAGDSVRFSGNDEELRTISDFASTVAANVTAEDAFGVRSNEIVSTVDFDPSVSLETPLAQLNRGRGVSPGAVSFGDGAEVITLDLANAHDLQDVVEKISGTVLGPRTLTASLTANGLTVAYADGLGGTLRIAEVGSGKTAESLGINNSAVAGSSPTVGTDLRPILTKETALSQLFGGTGITIGELFQIRQGEKDFVVSTNGIATVEDLINRIHASGAQVVAAIAPSGEGFSIQSTESGTAFSIGERGTGLATKLGIRSMTGTTPLSRLNFGQGIFTNEDTDDLLLTRSDGTQFSVDLSGAQNVQDVIEQINNNVDNFTPALRIQASLATNGNGIVLSAPDGLSPIRVRNIGGSQAAWGLGLVPTGSESASGTTVGTRSVISGGDVSGVEVEGVFTSLIRMRQALDANRPEDMIRITAGLDDDIQRMSLARGLVGTRQQSIERTRDLSAEQQLQLKEIESIELDADLAQVISELSAREAALQASLQLMGQTSRQTLFNYI